MKTIYRDHFQPSEARFVFQHSSIPSQNPKVQDEEQEIKYEKEKGKVPKETQDNLKKLDGEVKNETENKTDIENIPEETTPEKTPEEMDVADKDPEKEKEEELPKEEQDPEEKDKKVVAEHPFLKITEEEFGLKKQDAKNTLAKLQGPLKQELLTIASSDPEIKKLLGDKSPQSAVDSALTAAFDFLNQKIEKDGYLPKYSELPETIINAFASKLESNMGLGDKISALWGKVSGGGVDPEAMKAKYIEKLTEVLSNEGIKTEYETADKTLESGHKDAEIYKRRQNGENILFYNPASYENLSIEQLEKAKKSKEEVNRLLATVDPDDPEDIRNEYCDGVLSGKIGIIYSEWFKNEGKDEEMSTLDKIWRGIKSNPIVKMFMKLWPAITKLISGEEVDWEGLFKNTDEDLKDKVKGYEDSTNDLEELNTVLQKKTKEKELREELTTEYSKHNGEGSTEDVKISDFETTLNNLELNDLESLQAIFPEAGSESLLGFSLKKNLELKNIITLHTLEKTKALEFDKENGTIRFKKGEKEFTDWLEITNENIKENRSAELWTTNIFENWPKGIEFGFTQNGEIKEVDMNSERSELSNLTDQERNKLVELLNNEKVKKFLQAVNKESISSEINGDEDGDECITLELLELIANSSFEAIATNDIVWSWGLPYVEQANNPDVDKTAMPLWFNPVGSGDLNIKIDGKWIDFDHFGHLIKILKDPQKYFPQKESENKKEDEEESES